MMSAAVADRKIHIIQGEFYVTTDPSVMVTTVLGSCVAACLRDPLAGIGGMNHFLLPGDLDRSSATEAERYGVHLMELLVNGLLQQGARRERLEAKLFGGARTMRGLSDIGKLNASFADRFLRNEGIKRVGGSLGGEQGRRIQYWPVSGRARQSLMAGHEAFAAPPKAVAPVASSNAGELELF